MTCLSMTVSSFHPGTCELGSEFCAVTTPHPWASTEIDLVGAALDEIGASDLGRRIMQRAGRNGFRTLTFCAGRTTQCARPVRRPLDDRRDDSH